MAPRLGLETLERRDTPAFTMTLAGTTATVIGDAAADTLVLDLGGANLRHNRFTAGDPGFASDLDWDTTVPGDQTLAPTSPSISIDTEAGDDVVQVGTAAFPARLFEAEISLPPSDPGDTVIIDNSGDTLNSAVQVATGGVETVVSGAAGGAVAMDPATVGSIVIRGGSDADLFSVTATGVGQALTIVSGAGFDRVSVNATAALTFDGFTIDGGAAFDILQVEAVPGATATVTHADAANGTIQVSGAVGAVTFSGFDRLAAFGPTAEVVVNLPATQNGGVFVEDDMRFGQHVAGVSLVTAATITPTSFDNPTSALRVNLGAAGDTVNVGPMDPAFAATGGIVVTGGAGADTFNTLSTLPVTIDGGAPTTSPGDILNLTDVTTNTTANPPAGTFGDVVYTGIEIVSPAVLPPPPPPPPPPAMPFAVGTGGGVTPAVRFFNPDATERFAASPFDSAATGGVRIASADFTGDGVPDVVVGTGPGVATRVRVLNGATQAEIFTTEPFEAAFTGGVYVAAGDITGDGLAELVITPDEGGGPRVRVLSGVGFGVLADFLGIDDANFRGGARPAIGDLDGDGFADLVISSGFGGGPRVAVHRGVAAGVGPKPFGDFFLFEQGLRNGAFVAVGDVNGDGKADLVGGGGPGGAPRVLIFSGVDLLAGKGDTSAVLANFFAGDTNSRGGIRVAAARLDTDARADLVVGAEAGAGNRVTAYLGANLTPVGTPPAQFEFDAFPGSTGGVFVG